MTSEAQRFEPDRERLSLALQAAGLGEFYWDYAADIIVVSPRMGQIMNLPSGRLSALRRILPVGGRKRSAAPL